MSGAARKARRAKAKREGRKPISLEKLRDGQIALSKGVREAFGRIIQLRQEVEPEVEELRSLLKHLLYRVTQLEVAVRAAGIDLPEPPLPEQPPDDSPGHDPAAAAAVAGAGLPDPEEEVFEGLEADDDEG